ncbi:MAG: RidA family protein, partial [Syntrophales bacterium]|nr:RidA family protein [Syntrophales bacterium]
GEHNREGGFMAERSIIISARAPKAIGPYAQAIRYGDLLFVSGMIPLDPKTGEPFYGSFEDQATLVLENLKAVIEDAGFNLRHVLKTTVYLKDLADFTAFNNVYARYFGNILPARETVQAAALPRNSRIEISAICGK